MGTNPDDWFKSNSNGGGGGGGNNNDNNAGDDIIDITQNDEEFKEFEYQNMNIMSKTKKNDDKKYNANLSMKRIRKKGKIVTTGCDAKKVLLFEDGSDNDKDSNNNDIQRVDTMNSAAKRD